MKTLWLEFWSRLSAEQRTLAKGIVGALAVVLVLLVVGQLSRPKPDPLRQQYEQAMREAAQSIKAATSNTAPAR